jgi:hypothetical protein
MKEGEGKPKERQKEGKKEGDGAQEERRRKGERKEGLKD